VSYHCALFAADPLAHIMRGLREHLMEKALRALVTPGYKDHIGLSTHNTTNWYVMSLSSSYTGI